MCTYCFSVEKNFTFGIDAVELQINPFIGCEIRLDEFFFIGAKTAFIVISAVLPVYIVPGVRYIDRFFLAGWTGKLPVPVQIDGSSHS